MQVGREKLRPFRLSFVLLTFDAPSFSLHSIDLALPLNGSINRADPAWTTDLLGLCTYQNFLPSFLSFLETSLSPAKTSSLQPLLRFRFSSDTTTITAFSKYNNVLAFNVGNEVINLATNTQVARTSPCLLTLRRGRRREEDPQLTFSFHLRFRPCLFFCCISFRESCCSRYQGLPQVYQLQGSRFIHFGRRTCRLEE